MNISKSMVIVSTSVYKTRYSVNLCISGNEPYEIFYSMAADFIRYLADCKVTITGDSFILRYEKDFVLWDIELADAIRDVLQMAEEYNREYDAQLSYQFGRKLWWNSRLIESHTNANEPFFDERIYREGFRWLSKRPYHGLSFKDFVYRYLSDHEREFILKDNFTKLFENWNVSEAQFIAKLYPEEITKLASHVMRPGLSLESVHDEWSIVSFTSLAIAQMICQS